MLAATMLAANVWHWWIGVALTLVGGAVLLILVAGYVKQVVSPQHPSKSQRRQMEAAQREAAGKT